MRDTERKYWSQQITEQKASGRSVREFCQERGLGEHSFYRWRKRLGSEEKTRFVLLTPRAESAAPEGFDAAWPVELKLASGECLRIAKGVDAATLRTVLEAVRR